MKRTYRIKVGFNFSEYALIKQKAQATGRTNARYIREIVLGKEIKLKQFSPLEKKAFLELTGIARNVNQVAHSFNVGDKNYIELYNMTIQVKSIINKLTGNGSENNAGEVV